jgi:hypothetical protein
MPAPSERGTSAIQGRTIEGVVGGEEATYGALSMPVPCLAGS